MGDAERDGWVTRVLGIALPTSRTATPDLRDAIVGWREAMEVVDRQIAALQAALRQTDDDDLHEIADYGLNAVTGGFKVRLTAALISTAKDDAPQERARLATVADGFRTHLETESRVAACDDNPFGVSMSIRATLVPALEVILASLGG